jgi:RNA polymerase sigma factor (sigma-70 family)
MPEHIPDTDHFNRAEARVERKDMLRIVRHAVDRLPRRYREVLLLAFLSELPNNEIARVLRMTEGGVRILKMRALRKLEALLPPDMGLSS